YKTWEDCSAQVHRFSGCKHKSFKSYEDTVNAWTQHKVGCNYKIVVCCNI
ncbi:RNase H1/viroplasmin domain-containing protein, partial [Mycobacterium kansasii]